MASETAAPYGVTTALAIKKPEGFSLVPQNFAEFEKAAKWLSESSLIPTALKGKQGDLMIAMEKLHQIGLNPIADLDGVAVINGRASIHSEKWLAVVQTSPGYLGEDDEWDAKTETAIVTFHRLIAGTPKSMTKTFSMADAKAANLFGKDGPWKNFPKDMCFWRARHRAGSVMFADRLHGIVVAEVVGDYAPARVEVEYVPTRKSEREAAVPVVEAEKVPEDNHAPAEPEKPAAESFVLSAQPVAIESKGKDWVLYKIETVDGGPFFSKEKAVADLASSLRGKAVRIVSVLRKGDKREATSIEAIAE